MYSGGYNPVLFASGAGTNSQLPPIEGLAGASPSAATGFATEAAAARTGAGSSNSGSGTERPPAGPRACAGASPPGKPSSSESSATGFLARRSYACALGALGLGADTACSTATSCDREAVAAGRGVRISKERIPASRIAPSAGHSHGGAFQSKSEEHTSELQSLRHLVCRLLL